MHDLLVTVSPVTRDLHRAQGTRVRIYYRTRVAYLRGNPHPVWGDNQAGVDDAYTAQSIARVLDIGVHHVLIHPDRQPRPVALHLDSVLRVARVPLLRVG